MKNHENLNGALVLVRPDLQDDPMRQQGKAGFVTYAREADEIHVGFTSGAASVYHGEDLFQLKPRNEILQALTDHGAEMDVTDYKNLYKIMLLVDKGTSTAQVSALELASQSPAIWDKVLRGAVPAREPEMAKSYGR